MSIKLWLISLLLCTALIHCGGTSSNHHLAYAASIHHPLCDSVLIDFADSLTVALLADAVIPELTFQDYNEDGQITYSYSLYILSDRYEQVHDERLDEIADRAMFNIRERLLAMGTVKWMYVSFHGHKGRIGEKYFTDLKNPPKP